MKQVMLVRTPGISTITIEGLGSMSTDDAIQVAAHIVFLVAGNLCDAMQDGRIVKWNMKASFFDEYRKIMEHPE